jgi:hypothetical protein
MMLTSGRRLDTPEGVLKVPEGARFLKVLSEPEPAEEPPCAGATRLARLRLVGVMEGNSISPLAE